MGEWALCAARTSLLAVRAVTTQVRAIEQTGPASCRASCCLYLNESLKLAGVYDLTQARRIQVLGDIRSRCDHITPNPPSKDEVWELIEGVHKFINDYPVK